MQRITVYRHFPDEISLLRACGGHYRSLHPPPDPASFRAEVDPELRLMRALVRLYAHFRETHAMWSHVLRDVEVSEVVREAAEPRFRYLREVRAILSDGFDRELARAAVAHAVNFRTWESLAAEGLSDEAAAELVTFMAVAARTA